MRIFKPTAAAYLVSPSHVVPHILAAVLLAAQAGLVLPLVYNTGGYDSLETLALLDGVVDIYMPDMKFASAQIARKYSKIPNYPRANQAVVREMHRQVGDLQVDGRGIAQRGLLVRHLVLPNDLAGTAEIVRFLAQEISQDTYLNLMDQYHPAFNASNPSSTGALPAGTGCRTVAEPGCIVGHRPTHWPADAASHSLGCFSCLGSRMRIVVHHPVGGGDLACVDLNQFFCNG
jgi:hypothetical protein